MSEDALQLKSRVVGLLDALAKEDVNSSFEHKTMANAVMQIVSNQLFMTKEAFVTYIKSKLADFTIAELSNVSVEMMQQRTRELEAVIAQAEDYYHVLAKLGTLLPAESKWIDNMYAWGLRLEEIHKGLPFSHFNSFGKWKNTPTFSSLAAGYLESVVNTTPDLAQAIWANRAAAASALKKAKEEEEIKAKAVVVIQDEKEEGPQKKKQRTNAQI